MRTSVQKADPKGYRRTIARIRAISTARISAPLMVGEMIVALGMALKTNSHPAVYVLPTPDTPAHDFVVWRGTETMTEELRMALEANFWPGPASVPRPHDVFRADTTQRIVAATLWGEGVADAERWEALWRERLVKHGLYAVFVAQSGTMCVALMSRGPNDPPFSAADIALVRACAPIIEEAIDRPQDEDIGLTDCDSVCYLRLGPDQSISAMSWRSMEILRQLGGGRRDGIAWARTCIEQAVVRVARDSTLSDQERERLTLAGGVLERPMRQALLDLSTVGPEYHAQLMQPLTVETNPFGRFALALVALADTSGRVEWLVTLRRYVPIGLLALRGALEVGAAARELELLAHLDYTSSIEAAALRIAVSPATARTLMDRLAERVGASGAWVTWEKLRDIGRHVVR
ncbi:MAG: hypothetical protein NW200_08410 [Hyphomonadaceae bacterium]|nr:hypothetical protein [Hyphomonadaceae bacterium]